MAAISKIRVVNLQYNGQQNYYEDEMFHFLDGNGIPSNGGITFGNGRGKGALMQAINQIFIPETTWGKNNENTPLHYFMKNEKFTPYTFYIMIEWWISYTQRLLTGIAMTAEETTNNSEREYKIKYRLFGKKYLKSEFSIDHVPVWNKTNKEVKEFLDFEEYLKKEKAFFHYSKSGKNTFLKECRNYGVYDTDWEEMKKINRIEAGIGDYFERRNATKNETLFRNMLVPSIIERNKSIEGIDVQNTLSQQFKDSAIIARNLPTLLSREKDHQEIINMVKRFEKPLEGYRFANEQVKEIKKEGENIVANIHFLIEDYRHRLQSIQDEMKDLLEKSNENKWKKDNLKYVKTLRDLEETKNELGAIEKDEKEAFHEKEQLEQNVRELEIKILVKKYRTAEKELNEINRDIKRLEESVEVEEIATQKQEIEQEVQEKWKSAYEKLMEIQQNCTLYSAMIIKRIKELQNSSQESSNKLGEWNQQIKDANKKVKEFEELLPKVQEKFGYSVHIEITEVMNSLNQKLQSAGQLLEKNEQDTEVCNNRKEEVAGKIGKLDTEIENLNKKEKELEKSLAKKQLNQKGWMENVSELLKIPLDECLDTHEWLNSKIPDLEEMYEKNIKREKQLNVSLLKLEQQLQISDDEHLILNADIQRISEKLTQQHIYHQTGFEFLMERNLEERLLYNEKNPLLKYSIIVQTQYLNHLRQKIHFEKELLQSPVHLVEAKELENWHDESFLFRNQADVFVENPDKWNEFLRASIEEKTKIEEEIGKVENEKEEILYMLNILKHFSFKDSAECNRDEILQLNREKVVFQGHLTELKIEDETIQKKIELLKTDYKTIQTQARTYETDISELNRFIENMKQYQNDKNVLETALKEKQSIESQLKNYQVEMTQWQQESNDWNDLYANWKANLNQQINQIQQIVKGATFPQTVEVDSNLNLVEKPNISQEVLDSIIYLMKQYEELTKTLSEKSSEISKLNGMRIKVLEQVRAAKKELITFDSRSLEEAEPVETEEILSRRKRTKREMLDGKTKQWQSLDSNKKSLIALVDNKQKQTVDLDEDIKQTHGRTVEGWSGYNLDIFSKEINEEEEIIKKELERKEIEEEKTEQEINNLINKSQIVELTMKIHNPFILEIQRSIQQELKENSQKLVENWSNEYERRLRRKNEATNELGRVRKRSIDEIKLTTWDEKIKQNILEQYQVMNENQVLSIEENLESIERYSEYELGTLEEDKLKGKEARSRWIKYAAQFSSNIVKAIFGMVESMEIKNRGGFVFPFVIISNKKKLTTKLEEYLVPLERYFDTALKKANDLDIPIESLKVREINDIISVPDIVYCALSNQYPIFDIYDLNADNTFMYDEPKAEYYIKWQVLNEASLTRASGSGGQQLSGKTIMFLMMMAQKRKKSEKDWQFLYLDNPFANAVSSNIMDPIMAITEAMKYQLIIFAPPELVKAEIAMKFPALHGLFFEKGENERRKVCINRRQYLEPTNFMTEEFENEQIGYSVVKKGDYEQGEFLLE